MHPWRRLPVSLLAEAPDTATVLCPCTAETPAAALGTVPPDGVATTKISLDQKDDVMLQQAPF